MAAAAAARVMGAAGALYHANTLTSSFLLKPFSITCKAIRPNRNLKAAPRRLFACRALYKPEVQIKEEGRPETLDYRVFLVDQSGRKVSPWHDVPLHLGDGVFNFIVEIPKESSAKMEVATDEPHTPIKQDTKKGKLRYYPYNINWNYGLLPQTWEDPSFANPEVEGAYGDNDPVDVVEIGERTGKIGEILKIKPLAALAMIDEGELDWKVVAISLDDPRASLLNDIHDVEIHFPVVLMLSDGCSIRLIYWYIRVSRLDWGKESIVFWGSSKGQQILLIVVGTHKFLIHGWTGTLTAIRDWFRDYKIPDGKPPNKFGLGNKAANKDYALKVITETNESWVKLVKRSIPAGELSLV